MVRENDREKFVKLAEMRVNKALKAIQLIGNLSNRSNYDYTDTDISKIFKVLSDELSNCKRRFEQSRKRQDHNRFTLE